MSDWKSIPSVEEWQQQTAPARKHVDLALFDRIVQSWSDIQSFLTESTRPVASTSTSPPPIDVGASDGRLQYYALAAFREVIDKWLLAECGQQRPEDEKREAEYVDLIFKKNPNHALLAFSNSISQQARTSQTGKAIRFPGFRDSSSAGKPGASPTAVEPNEQDARMLAWVQVRRLDYVIEKQLISVLNAPENQQDSYNLRRLLFDKLELTIKEHGLCCDAEVTSAYQASPEQIRNREVFISGGLLHQINWLECEANNTDTQTVAPQCVPLDTEHIYAGAGYNNCGKYYYGFAMNCDYKIFASNQHKDYSIKDRRIISFHASYTRGHPVLCAGTIAVRKGKLMIVSADSGHYQPTPERLLIFLQYLHLRGANLTGTWVTWCSEFSKVKQRNQNPTELLATQAEMNEYRNPPANLSQREIADKIYERTRERKMEFSKRARTPILFADNSLFNTTLPDPVPMNIYRFQVGDQSIVYRENGNMDYPRGKTPKPQVPGSFYDKNQVYYAMNIKDVEIEVSGIGTGQLWCLASDLIKISSTAQMDKIAIKNDDAERAGVPREILEWSE